MLIGMWRVISTFMVISCGHLQLCGAQDLTCTVSQVDGCTVYNISDVSNASDGKALDCHYSWTNETNHVLANQMEKTAGLVRTNGIDILVTSECFDKITLSRSCISELTERTAYCTANCSMLMKIIEDRTEIQKQEMSYAWIVPVATVVIPVLVVLFVLCYRFRENIKRSCSRGDAGVL